MIRIKNKITRDQHVPVLCYSTRVFHGVQYGRSLGGSSVQAIRISDHIQQQLLLWIPCSASSRAEYNIISCSLSRTSSRSTPTCVKSWHHHYHTRTRYLWGSILGTHRLSSTRLRLPYLSFLLEICTRYNTTTQYSSRLAGPCSILIVEAQHTTCTTWYNKILGITRWRYTVLLCRLVPTYRRCPLYNDLYLELTSPRLICCAVVPYQHHLVV